MSAGRSLGGVTLGQVRYLVRALALVGALSLVLLLVAVVTFWSASVPTDEAMPFPNSPTASAPAPLPSGDDVVLDATSMTADRLLSSGGELRDLYAVARDLRTSGGAVAAGALDVDVTVPFGSVETQVGHGIRLRHDGSGQLRAEAPVTFLGRTLTVSAVGRVVPQGREIVFEPVAVDIPGPQALQGALLAISQRALTLRQEVPGLPAGMALTTLDVRDDGFRAHVRGHDVRLSR